MKAFRNGSTLIAAAFLLTGTSAVGQFLGYISGYNAPAIWTTFVSGNPLHQTTTFVCTRNAPPSVATTAQHQVQAGAPEAKFLSVLPIC